MPTLLENELLCAIDLGSNSFHLAIARLSNGKLKKVATMSEKVQLGAGLDENNILSEEACQKGFECLRRFVGRLDNVSTDNIRIVATNAIRQAVNGDDFMRQANQILPKPIEIISGREEARLIYLGVASTSPSEEQRLVVDIGGGSTELIIGREQAILTESAQMGCVSFTQQFFKDGYINHDNFEKPSSPPKKKLLSTQDAIPRQDLAV